MVNSKTDYAIDNPRKRLHHGMTTMSSSTALNLEGESKTFATLSSIYMLQPKSKQLDCDVHYFGGGKRVRRIYSISGPYREVIKFDNECHLEDSRTSWEEVDENDSVPDIMDADDDNTEYNQGQLIKKQNCSSQYEDEIDQLMNTWTTSFGEDKNWAKVNLKTIRQQYQKKDNCFILNRKSDDRKLFLKNKQKEARRFLMKGILQPHHNL